MCVGLLPSAPRCRCCRTWTSPTRSEGATVTGHSATQKTRVAQQVARGLRQGADVWRARFPHAQSVHACTVHTKSTALCTYGVDDPTMDLQVLENDLQDGGAGPAFGSAGALEQVPHNDHSLPSTNMSAGRAAGVWAANIDQPPHRHAPGPRPLSHCMHATRTLHGPRSGHVCTGRCTTCCVCASVRVGAHCATGTQDAHGNKHRLRRGTFGSGASVNRIWDSMAFFLASSSSLVRCRRREL